MEPTQLDGQQQISQNQNGHSNGHAFPQQKQCHDGLGRVSVVATKDDEEQLSLKSLAHHLYSPSSSSSDSSSSLNGDNKVFINGSQHPPTSNMQPVDVDSSVSTTASNSATSPSASLVSSSPIVSPTTPTPSSVSLMFQRLHPSQLDVTSHPTSLESINTPKQSGDVYSSAGASKNDSVEGEGSQLGTKIIIPEPSTLVSSIDSNPNSSLLPSSIPNNTSLNSIPTPTNSRPTSVTIDTTLFSNRPAPPSPALSRRVSGAPSTASSTHSSNSNSRPRSQSSITRRPSMGTSRASLKRMSGVGSDAKRQSLGNQLNQFENSTTSTASSLPFGSLNKLTFTPSSSSTHQATSSTATASSPTIPTLSDSTISDPIPTTSITPTATPTISSLPQPSSPPPATARIYIKVRDFGFPPTDERHLGLGADIPKANRVHRLNRKLGGPDRATARAAAALDPSSSMGSRKTDSIGSIGSVDSSDADAEEEEEEEEEDGKGGSEGWGIGFSGWGKGGNSKGWDGFKLGMGRFSWNIRSNHSNIRNGNEDSDNKDKNSKGTSSTNGIFPSRKDLDMNFMDSLSSSSDDDDGRPRQRVTDQGITEEFNDDDDDFDETVGDDDREQDGEYEEPQEPLYPGLYRALYPFEPEGMAEMELDENQIVRVVGRGGGIGWAVVVDERCSGGDGDEEGGGGGGKVQVKHALVPESYLEAVTLDWEEEEEEGLEVAESEDGGGDGDGGGSVKVGDA